MASTAELRELDDEELETRLAEYRRDLLNLRFQLATGQLDNVARLGQVRRDVARTLTEMRDREIALAEGRQAAPVVVAPAVRRSRRVAREEAEVEEAEVEESEPEVAEVEEAEVEAGAGQGVEELEEGEPDEAEPEVSTGQGVEELQGEDVADLGQDDDELEAGVLGAEDEALALGALPAETEEDGEAAEPAPADKGRRLGRARRRRVRGDEEDQ